MLQIAKKAVLPALVFAVVTGVLSCFTTVFFGFRVAALRA
jgi:hypothetical protein